MAASGIAALAYGQGVDIDYVDATSGNWRETVSTAVPNFEPARSQLEARRQARQAGERVRAALNAEAYFDPTIDFAITSEDPPRPRLRVDPGPRFAVGEITVVYDGPAPDEAEQDVLADSLQLASGDLAIPARILSAERALLAKLRTLGYAEADTAPRDVIGDRETAEIHVILKLRAGPRIRFGELLVPDGLKTSTDYINTLKLHQPGDLYSPDILTRFNRRLAETRLFTRSSARLAPSPSEIDPETGDEIRDLVLEMVERPRHTIAVGASYSTADGYGLSSEFTRRNLTRSGDVLEAQLNLAELSRNLDIHWRRPNEFGFGRGLVFSTRLSDDTTDAFDRQSIRVGSALEIIESPRIAWTVGASGEVLSETGPLGDRDLQLLFLNGGLRLDYSNSLLDPTQGWRLDSTATPTYVFGDESTRYVRLGGQASAYLPFGEDDRFVLAGRAHLGSVLGAAVSDLPSEQRFYAGGGGSVRGYAYQAIGPRDDENAPTGGRGLTELSLEMRWRGSGRFGAVAFVDGGSVSEARLPRMDDLSLGAGLGVRYQTPAGPVRLDLATPLNKGPDDDPVQVYISIGQAF
ncbi:MAG: autotransporter assembly complex protein TamA [Hyphomonadaceae bacterium]|nr:autotransporter assembly complex protein TamA [Hyphomonadaceae bacterium]